MPPRRKSRIYTRVRGGSARHYADFRDYADVGGGQEALCPRGSKWATADPDVAARLAHERIEELEERRRKRHLLQVEREVTLAAFADEHLAAKAEEGTTSQWLTASELHFARSVEFFGRIRPWQLGGKLLEEPQPIDIASIGVADVRAWVTWLGQIESGRGAGKRLSAGSVRHHLNTLSNLFTRAISEGYVRPGSNPVAALMAKPSGRDHVAEWMEVHDAALFLEAARRAPEVYAVRAASAARRLSLTIERWMPDVPMEAALAAFQARMREMGKRCSDAQLAAYLGGERVPEKTFVGAAAAVLEVDGDWLRRGGAKKTMVTISPYVHPLIATLLLTGGREAEILGLEMRDVSFDRKTIHIRPNDWRRLKTRGSHRVVRMWPQLEEILRPWVFPDGSPRAEGLLFPGEDGKMITDVRKPLDAIADLAGWQEGEIRTKRFRHTYASARLQTLDAGAPVQPWTVARELGHTSLDMINRIYGHLGEVRHRSEVVEYRVRNHLGIEGYGDRVRALSAGGL